MKTGTRIQAAMWKRFLGVLPYFYLLRIPFLCALFLFLFPVVAIGPAKALFQNLFRLDFWGTFWCAATALLAAWGVVLTANLIVLNGSVRFKLPQLYAERSLRGWISA